MDLDAYARLHRHPLNLLLHAVSVPLFALAVVGALLSLVVPRGEIWWGGSVAVGVYAVLLQRSGHRLEPERPPRRGAARAVADFLAEQFAIFPRFVLGGGFAKGWRGARRPPPAAKRPSAPPPRRLQ